MEVYIIRGAEGDPRRCTSWVSSAAGLVVTEQGPGLAECSLSFSPETCRSISILAFVVSLGFWVHPLANS